MLQNLTHVLQNSASRRYAEVRLATNCAPLCRCDEQPEVRQPPNAGIRKLVADNDFIRGQDLRLFWRSAKFSARKAPPGQSPAGLGGFIALCRSDFRGISTAPNSGVA